MIETWCADCDFTATRATRTLADFQANTHRASTGHLVLQDQGANAL